jgi:hypothetical protein
MRTQLEQELANAKILCQRALRKLSRSWLARLFASEEQRYIIEELECLLKEIDGITGLSVVAKHSIRDSKEVRQLLLELGYCSDRRSQLRQLIQLTSPEYDITEQLLKVQKLNYDSISQINRQVESYNSQLRSLLIYREQSTKARWVMDLIGFPDTSDMPYELDVQLINDFYEESLNPYLGHYFIEIPEATGD